MNTENAPSTTPEVIVKTSKNNNDNLVVHVNTAGKKGKKKGHHNPLSTYLCVSSVDAKIIKRVKRAEAERLVASGGFTFIPRSTWKKLVRDVKGSEVIQVAIDEKKGIVKKSKVKNDKPRKSKEHKEEKGE